MLRKDQDFKWIPEAQRVFANIKAAIFSSLVLVSPNFDKYFILYSLSFEDTITKIVTQKNQKGEQMPIYFMNKDLPDYELRYSPLEKKAFALVKFGSHFRPYILSTPVKDYVPHPPIKMMLSQPLREGRWANWFAKL